MLFALLIISPRKVCWVVSGGGGWQTKFSVSPGPGLWSLVLGPFGHDLGPFGPDLGPGPELDNIQRLAIEGIRSVLKTKVNQFQEISFPMCT